MVTHLTTLTLAAVLPAIFLNGPNLAPWEWHTMGLALYSESSFFIRNGSCFATEQCSQCASSYKCGCSKTWFFHCYVVSAELGGIQSSVTVFCHSATSVGKFCIFQSLTNNLYGQNLKLLSTWEHKIYFIVDLIWISLVTISNEFEYLFMFLGHSYFLCCERPFCVFGLFFNSNRIPTEL
jgi:hypothetical protein